MLKFNLCDYSGAYILVKRKITVTGAGVDAADIRLDERNN